MSSSPANVAKPKKSVALSGVAAGNTALCTVGRSGNDLHYRGYDILDFADQAQFEEIAYLLVHEKLPSRAELAAYKKKLQSLRTLPAPLRRVLEEIPASAHPMDVMRTAVSTLGTLEPEAEGHHAAGARDIADRLMACLGGSSPGITSRTRAGASTPSPTTMRSAAIPGTCCTAKSRAATGCARCTPRSSSTPSTSSTRAPSPAA
jgi:citrate synthase